jgi:hypothetical protein
MSGLDKDVFRTKRRFVPPSLPDTLQAAYCCVLCEQVLDVERPHQSSCGDRACCTCVEVLTKVLKEQRISDILCPACNEPLEPSSFFPDRAVQRELSAIKVSCPHGCSWSNIYKEYPVHLQSCPLLPVSCPHSPCTAKSVPKQLEEHLVVCPYRPVTCQYCTKMMYFKVLEIHEVKECDRRPVPCPLCSAQVPFNAVSCHMCSYTYVFIQRNITNVQSR